MIILLGKTSSGKDTVLNRLVARYDYKKLVTYTTRPMRDGEEQDVTYHFLSEDDFKQKIENRFFAEWKTYNTEFGIWFYGTALDDLENADDKSIIILTPQGYFDIKNKLSNNVVSVYISANNKTIKKRLLKRGDDRNEAQRRLEHDNKDFAGIENQVDKIIYNNEGTNIDDVVEKLLNVIKERK